MNINRRRTVPVTKRQRAFTLNYMSFESEEDARMAIADMALVSRLRDAEVMLDEISENLHRRVEGSGESIENEETLDELIRVENELDLQPVMELNGNGLSYWHVQALLPEDTPEFLGGEAS